MISTAGVPVVADGEPGGAVIAPHVGDPALPG